MSRNTQPGLLLMLMLMLVLLLLLLLLQGTKWTATKWIHNKPYGGGFDPLKLAAQCRDTADDCR
jgi:hypothetical protein